MLNDMRKGNRGSSGVVPNSRWYTIGSMNLDSQRIHLHSSYLQKVPLVEKEDMWVKNEHKIYVLNHNRCS